MSKALFESALDEKIPLDIAFNLVLLKEKKRDAFMIEFFNGKNVSCLHSNKSLLATLKFIETSGFHHLYLKRNGAISTHLVFLDKQKIMSVIEKNNQRKKFGQLIGLVCAGDLTKIWKKNPFFARFSVSKNGDEQMFLYQMCPFAKRKDYMKPLLKQLDEFKDIGKKVGANVIQLRIGWDL